MKKKKSAIVIILLALLLPLCLCFSAGAAENDFYTLNEARIKEKLDLLDALMNGYSNTAINSEITPYASALMLLRGDARINTEDLSHEINMYYVKGRIAGNCAWVYVNYSSSLGEDELSEVSVKYRDTLNSIKGNSDVADLEAKEELYALNLMKEIYAEKIAMLYDGSDSQAVSLLAYSYELKIREIATFDEAEFERVYREAETAIEIQRLRERAEVSFSSLYNVVYGDGAYAENCASDRAIVSFLYALKQSDTVAQFNANIKEGAENILSSLFEGRDGEYCEALLAGLRATLTERVAAADALGNIADNWSDFEGLSLRIEKAGAKDALVDYVSVSSSANIAGVSDILAEYNADGAIFDTCSDTDTVALELSKAKIRVDLLVYLRHAEAEVRGIYGEKDASAQLGKIEALGAAYGEAIKNKAVISSAEEALIEAKAEADKIVSEARALLEEYRENARRVIDVELESCLYDIKHELGYLENADAIVAAMRGKHRLRSEEISAAQSISELHRIVSEAQSELDALYAEAEKANLVAAIADNVKKIRDKESWARAEIEKLGYLSDRNVYTSPVSEKANEAAEAVALEAEIAQIELLATQYLEYADGIIGNAKSENAENERIYIARESAKRELASAKQEALEKLGELKYLSKDESAAARASIETIYADALSLIETEGSVDGIGNALARGAEDMNEVVSGASTTNTENARRVILAELEGKFRGYAAEDYSKENYKLISEAYGGAVSAVESGKIISDFVAARDKAFALMDSVLSQFDTAKLAAKKEISGVYSQLTGNADRYSEENLEELKEIYERTLSEIESLDKNQGAEALADIVGERVKLMKNIKVDWVNAGDIGIESGSSADYPAGYDTAKDKLWGVVSGSDGLHFDTSLSITEKDIQKSHKSSLKKALEKASISYIGNDPMTDADIADIIGDSDIWAVYDIKLIRDGKVWRDFSGRYTVKILLPASMRDIGGLRAVYISDDGSAEFYDARREGAFLVFETSHFSEFIIVGEKQVNLLPIIIILAVIAIIEAATAAALFYVLRKGRADALMSVALPMPMLTVIAPKGGIVWIIILAIADIALGAYIAVCAARLLKQREEAKPVVVPSKHESADFGDEIVEEREVPSLPIELMESVSAEQADSLVPDGSVEAIIVRENSPEIYRGKKAFVNVDTISEHFEAGATVTLGELKKKKLVATNVCYLKVLARGVIDKPLTVKAQSFSANAVKMIALTGGAAVIESNREYIDP